MCVCSLRVEWSKTDHGDIVVKDIDITSHQGTTTCTACLSVRWHGWLVDCERLTIVGEAWGRMEIWKVSPPPWQPILAISILVVSSLLFVSCSLVCVLKDLQLVIPFLWSDCCCYDVHSIWKHCHFQCHIMCVTFSSSSSADHHQT